jgi:competence protein ComEC
VGQGDAILVQGRQGAMLVDAGRALPGRFDMGRSVVVPALRALGISHLDLLAVSHLDVDHRGGVPAVLRAMSIGELWLPRGSRHEPAASELLEAARHRGVRVVERGAGDAPVRFGDLRVESLWPPNASRPPSGNDASLVLRIQLADSVLLLPGDLEAGGEADLLATGAELRADILKLAHHGSRTSSTPEFLEAVGARVAIASAGCFGRFGMPHEDVVERVRSHGTPVWWTGRDGAIRVRLATLSVRPISVWGTGPWRGCRPLELRAVALP